MKKPRIVIIGAGSASFSLSIIRDLFTTKELWGSELVFVDINKEALDFTVNAVERINSELKSGYLITKTVDRKEALKGAKYIIVSVAVNRNEMWKKDFLIPKKYGIDHVLGENGGPGAAFHTIRNIPIILDICKDIETICPDALLINFTNPESRICLAIKKYTKVKAVGLCHQIGEGIKIVSKIMDKDPKDIDVKACGLNHFTWMTDIRDKVTGEDLYPLLREKELGFNKDFEKLSRFMFHKFGLFPTSGDGHLGEYIPFASEMMETDGYDFDFDEKFRVRLHKFMKGIGDGTLSIDAAFDFPGQGEITIFHPSGEKELEIIKGIEFNTNAYIISVNLPNDGYITNLPNDAIVEVPAMVSGKGVYGIGMGDLPRGIASMCLNQINIQHLVVDAGVNGDRNLLKQALLLDPCVSSAFSSINIYNDLMEENKPYYPQFNY